MVGCVANKKFFAAELGVTPYLNAIRRVYMNGLQSSNLKAATPKIHSVLDKTIEIIDEQRVDGPVEFQNLCVATERVLWLVSLQTDHKTVARAVAQVLSLRSRGYLEALSTLQGSSTLTRDTSFCRACRLEVFERRGFLMSRRHVLLLSRDELRLY